MPVRWISLKHLLLYRRKYAFCFSSKERRSGITARFRKQARSENTYPFRFEPNCSKKFFCCPKSFSSLFGTSSGCNCHIFSTKTECRVNCTACLVYKAACRVPIKLAGCSVTSNNYFSVKLFFDDGL